MCELVGIYEFGNEIVREYKIMICYINVRGKTIT